MRRDFKMPENTPRPKRSVFHKQRKEAKASTPVIEARAVAKYLRISPLKARDVVNAIRGKNVGEAFQILEFSPKKAARLVYKVLRSAVANAENNFGLDVDNLYVSEAVVEDGPRMKRLWTRGRGRADILLKRFSHIRLAVKDREKEKELTNPQERGDN
ncbi:MAG: 50S ribosomal protein L22 [Thermotogae bacterium]|uniref:Large ribosomal subunit protein uL22 n=2 Tax=Kosmotoga TaxID=651456 RepID=A0A7C5I338_9BACT|nr:50S ribosomal protein L22 [Kosmotoga sp.]RKX50628.1 MAG: 50S ribosomal protein L22 [Thermotogota bacterium]HHF08414.1 50S ribosomal protein L22 [Kosmotoga arenicorallina]